jgi:hypothetical protein
MSSVSGFLLPAQTDPRWASLVRNGTSAPLKLLALKIVLTRMNRSVKLDPSLACVAKNVAELHGFFIKNARSIEADTATLFR